MELWDIYDENRQFTGESIDRNQFPKEGYRLTVHVCIFNSKGEMLIQQRSDNKKFLPGAWDITLGGCVQAGETTKDACKRELFEELNISVDTKDLKSRIAIHYDNGFGDYYCICRDLDLSTVNFNDNEVQAVKWASKKEILKLIKKKKFINYYPAFVNALFEMKHATGAFELVNK